MIIDAHTHIGESIFGYKQTPIELICSMDECGIDMAVLCPVKPFSYHLEPENDFVAKTVREFPNRFIGFGRVDPRLGKKAVLELDRCIRELGLKGIMLHPWEETFAINSKLVYPIMEKAATYGIPVMVSGGHTRLSHPLQIGDIASEFPEVNIIATSGGQINISGMALYDAEMMLEENKNVYMETSGIYREDFIENMIRKLGSHRVIFGSNSPQLDLRYELLRIQTAEVGEDERKDVLGKTIARLLKL